ncbi:hypothetical protein QSJ18_01010 [Gordonia sp. ABSL1-1]|uniref:hypothetical protein n=1 Tax=Gordonia sp. ABSL1-1 TaxID=3053923 RepID=UPI0025744CC1|nr:hypothetical protein [Gordonia sp. ABSL1-1]MDL9935315.1 hypothetical protein [Gordonia sp. ABSL1-1]
MVAALALVVIAVGVIIWAVVDSDGDGGSPAGSADIDHADDTDFARDFFVGMQTIRSGDTSVVRQTFERVCPGADRATTSMPESNYEVAEQLKLNSRVVGRPDAIFDSTKSAKNAGVVLVSGVVESSSPEQANPTVRKIAALFTVGRHDGELCLMAVQVQ